MESQNPNFLLLPAIFSGCFNICLNSSARYSNLHCLGHVGNFFNLTKLENYLCQLRINGKKKMVDLGGSDAGGIWVGWQFLLCRLKPGLTSSVRDVRVGVMDMLFSQGRPHHEARQP